MSGFSEFIYHGNELYVESVPLKQIAEEFGTPCYVYSRSALTQAYQEFDSAFANRDHLICYAVKANSNIAILNLLAQLGSGFDIVSGGELLRVIKAGGDPKKIVFSGVGKNIDEMRMALEANILCFNVESEAELIVLNQIAKDMGTIAPVSLRVNPNVDAKTHPYISTGLQENKFGIPANEAEEIYRSAHQYAHIRFTGLDCHIGSQLTALEPFMQASNKMLTLLDTLQSQGLEITHLDLGGGLGIRYTNETPPSIKDYVSALCACTQQVKQRLLIEPGRSLVGNSGILLTRIEYLKHTPARNFAIVDAAMNDLMRPALYDAYHEILPVIRNKEEIRNYQVVGPVCETGDFLGHDRKLGLINGDLLAIMSAGAYGMSMSSNYNTRPRAAEIMVDKNTIHIIRQRETIDQLIATERILS
ncbi:MAG: diaminopimelate decarboxylase [Nitrosomonas sp.]|uniref:diaminopimelate decarboxylase n=2 Tax=Nitrosomonas sp. TaxID=42353 RepID=UPI0027236DE4|nr:diaminopimelate decarboxylase [Nitrosomonas sp.]MDO8895431.1 diaminopimelate decarboxylase [Nitrosomonas sp.]MDO9470650.1 diaminopimelate decarboxylase [Nitrosomonas sp.]MDP1788313.1 diaminopimelate decarboxylase [Nitrosomonas sp.]MDP2224765.1 diaminopimelate decarboxylase [Nitrosomonas sp.]